MLRQKPVEGWRLPNSQYLLACPETPKNARDSRLRDRDNWPAHLGLQASHIQALILSLIFLSERSCWLWQGR